MKVSFSGPDMTSDAVSESPELVSLFLINDSRFSFSAFVAPNQQLTLFLNR